ncbi:MAG: baseplate J/gp47 family protein, partial [Ktedonobacteraceae bacterium]|nr:baseplate J/gp47 family protein [Ktedonobacteraceae bacterium]
VIIILLLVVVAATAYFGPAAEVSLTLQTKPYSHNLTIIAQNGNGAPGSVAAQLQTKTFSKNGTLIATGNKEVGTNAAQGTVTFKNNGKQRAIVPTNTVVATTSGIQFKTNAEASLGPSGQIGSTVPVPVTAVQVGDSGNVNAQTITTIPQESLNAIARYNNMNATALQLSVTNDNPTTGGGKGTKHTVQKSDLDNVRKDLHNQLQKDIDAWVNQWSSKGVHGNPSSTDQLVNAPAVDAIVNDINVPITLNVTTTLLYIPNDTLQQAAVTQLNTLMSKDNAYRGDHVLEQQGQPPVKLDQLKPPAGDAKSMTLTFKASTLASPKITQDDVRSRIVGQSVDSAVATLSKLPGVQHVEIKPWPDFITWVPTWTGRINVRFTRGTSTALAGAF